MCKRHALTCAYIAGNFANCCFLESRYTCTDSSACSVYCVFPSNVLTAWQVFRKEGERRRVEKGRENGAACLAMQPSRSYVDWMWPSVRDWFEATGIVCCVW